MRGERGREEREEREERGGNRDVRRLLHERVRE